MVIAGRNEDGEHGKGDHGDSRQDEDGEHGKGDHGERREPSEMQVSMQEFKNIWFQCRSLKVNIKYAYKTIR
jgi:hypothetical protein